jgi:hypothetical protein
MLKQHTGGPLKSLIGIEAELFGTSPFLHFRFPLNIDKPHLWYYRCDLKHKFSDPFYSMVFTYMFFRNLLETSLHKVNAFSKFKTGTFGSVMCTHPAHFSDSMNDYFNSKSQKSVSLKFIPKATDEVVENLVYMRATFNYDSELVSKLLCYTLVFT